MNKKKFKYQESRGIEFFNIAAPQVSTTTYFFIDPFSDNTSTV